MSDTDRGPDEAPRGRPVGGAWEGGAADDGGAAGLVDRARRGLERVVARIEGAGGDPARIKIVAVTKGFGPEAVEAALDLGVVDIGENYAAELLSKHEALAGLAVEPAWHYLGRVQRRKVRGLAPVVSLWQSVSRAAEGEEIARRAPGAAVLVEVDTTGDPNRFGVPSSEAAALVAHLRELDLDVRGLMTVAPHGEAAEARSAFDVVRSLADQLELRVRSMGMSGDLEEAVRAGSTMVRVGEAVFGPRTGPTGLAQ